MNEIRSAQYENSTFSFNTVPDSNISSKEVQDPITQEQATSKLETFSKDKLDLPGEISQYDLQIEEMTQQVNHVDCYMIHAFSNTGTLKKSVGDYAVAVDGSIVFKIDVDTGNYIVVK